jgi:hypothetical protein
MLMPLRLPMAKTEAGIDEANPVAARLAAAVLKKIFCS